MQSPAESANFVQLGIEYIELLHSSLPSPRQRHGLATNNIAAMSIATAAIEAQEGGFIVGLKTDEVLPRLEIDEFILDTDVLNLFLLALIRLQDDKYHTEPFSWYQISGKQGAQQR